MRIPTFLLWALILFSVDTLSNISKSQEIIDDEMRVRLYSSCANADHARLYSFGESLSYGWYSLPEYFPGGFSPPDTQKSFIMRSFTGLNKLMSARDEFENEYESNIMPCDLGYLKNATKHSWSSVHSGLVDYLSSEDKVLFLSLPER